MVLTLALAACDRGEEKKPASQVAAKVNSGEISIHQINFLLARMPGVPPEKANETRRQILDSLIDQELAIQKAVETKLDRDPKVMQTLEAARREVLAKAYLEQTIASKSKPSPEDTKAYYREHPELFTERKIYRMQEIAFPARPELIALVREMVEKAKSGEEVLNALRTRGVQATANVMVKPAESIPLEVLPQLSKLKDGQSGIFEKDNMAALLTLVKSTTEPLSEEAARPVIEQYLARRQAGELAKEAIHRLRDKARIEYVGDFGKEAEADRQAREAEDIRKAEETREARKAARLAQETEAARRAEEMRKAREAADATRSKSPARLPAPADETVNKGLTNLK